jgi:hypothetical protein
MSAWNRSCMENDIELIRKREHEVIELAKRAATGDASAALAAEKGLTEINTMSRRLLERYVVDKQGRVELKAHHVN